jgi:hypothetical protein
MFFHWAMMPLNLWYVIRPFLHLLHMGKISSGVVSLWQIIRLIIWFQERSTSGCKRNTMSQHDYFWKGLHIHFPRKNIFIWMNCGTLCYNKCLYSCPDIFFFGLSFLNKYEFFKVSRFLPPTLFQCAFKYKPWSKH